jgi:hypothetical protein
MSAEKFEIENGSVNTGIHDTEVFDECGCQRFNGGSALRKLIGRDNLATMKLEEIEREAIALAEQDRVDLVCKLLDTLPPPGTDVSDEEVAKRESELDKGEVEELSHDEFVRRVEKERGK